MLKQENSSLPKSLQEAKAQGSNKYYTGEPCKKGHDSYRYTRDRVCAECVKIKVKNQSTIGGGNARRWANKTEKQLLAIYKKRKKYYEATREARLEERIQSYKKLSADSNWMQKKRDYTNNYRKTSIKGKSTHLAATVKRRLAKVHRTPKWLTEDDYWIIEQAYELAALRTKMFGFSWHVDHITPLQGKLVSGLHVPTNLQVIPGTENVAKANRYIPS